MTKKKPISTEVNMNDEQHGAKETNSTRPENDQDFGPEYAQQAVDVHQDAPVEEALAEVAALEQVEQLKKELEESHAQVSEYLDGWQRSRAEFANYKKRVDREQAQYQQVVAGTIIKRFLEIIDDLDRALKNRPQSDEGASWAAGIELIYRKFLSILEAEGVKVMDVEGKIFDPNLHEAISEADVPGYESGQIVEEIHKGYMIGDRVLRPALVRVAK